MDKKKISYFSLILETRALLTTFHTNCPDGTHFAQMGSTPTLFFTLLYWQQSHNPFWDAYVHKRPQSPPPNTLPPCLSLKVSKMNYSLGSLDPNWAKCLKNGQNFSRRGKKTYSWPKVSITTSLTSFLKTWFHKVLVSQVWLLQLWQWFLYLIIWYMLCRLALSLHNIMVLQKNTVVDFTIHDATYYIFL